MFRAVRVAGALTLAATYLALAGPADAATVTMTGETLNTAPLASTVSLPSRRSTFRLPALRPVTATVAASPA